MRKIKLSNGKKATVDDIDYDKVSRYKWRFHPMGYAWRKEDKKYIFMHRFILGDPLCTNGLQVDHKNRNKLDNRRENIWFCTPQENLLNRGLFKNNKSGYKGVWFDKQKNKWRASVTICGKTKKAIGCFETPKEAYNAYLRLVNEKSP